MKATQRMPIKVLVKQVRESRGLSQNDLARKMGQSNNNIQKIERMLARSITWETLELLCEALDCQPGDLLTWVPDSKGEAQPSP